MDEAEYGRAHDEHGVVDADARTLREARADEDAEEDEDEAHGGQPHRERLQLVRVRDLRLDARPEEHGPHEREERDREDERVVPHVEVEQELEELEPGRLVEEGEERERAHREAQDREADRRGVQVELPLLAVLRRVVEAHLERREDARDADVERRAQEREHREAGADDAQLARAQPDRRDERDDDADASDREERVDERAQEPRARQALGTLQEVAHFAVRGKPKPRAHEKERRDERAGEHEHAARGRELRHEAARDDERAQHEERGERERDDAHATRALVARTQGRARAARREDEREGERGREGADERRVERDEPEREVAKDLQLPERRGDREELGEAQEQEDDEEREREEIQRELASEGGLGLSGLARCAGSEPRGRDERPEACREKDLPRDRGHGRDAAGERARERERDGSVREVVGKTRAGHLRPPVSSLAGRRRSRSSRRAAGRRR